MRHHQLLNVLIRCYTHDQAKGDDTAEQDAKRLEDRE